ncbi:glycoside hydrolase family 3 C-terminal domain-containing protein [Mucilaginibacter sp. BJC16-A38]|uniref:glycoside hydrolase family 3 N-terminal domain-containing protein n=1 Tax=Mucilaginibacter phenanthrenivorans TaxID=1234842 RepID=UPI0021579D26|nr:glycoside hydrolase family 3 N-terminal domain-containing protein [Mucilaginibacter phenanthrenivorans]MCR8558352.1 glycoside hydrolase family 3 C-terminal domain-containing protein [Mucilaginibacter phenanthrenivorans]
MDMLSQKCAPACHPEALEGRRAQWPFSVCLASVQASAHMLRVPQHDTPLCYFPINRFLKFKSIILFLATFLSVIVANAQLYKNPKAPVEARVKDLLGRMTLEEKVGQMSMTTLKNSVTNPLAYGVCESPFVTINEIARLSIAAKKYAREKTRLGIPPIQIGECLHGQLASGATIFPQAIALGSTWNPALVKQMATVIAYEASSSGVDQALSPLFDLIRDPRFGRVEECYAEDPFLVSQMGTAFVTGMQGDPTESLLGIGKDKVMCTAKHFAAYSIPVAGINLAPASVGERELRSIFLPPFQAAVQKANIYSVMPAYNEIDGIPAHVSNFLLNQVLRKEWGFKGYVFSDYEGLKMLYTFHKITPNAEGAAIRGLNAGVDLEAPEANVYDKLIGLIKAGKVKEANIDTAVARILRVKFKAGLFEKPLADTTKLKERVHTPAHIALSQNIAEESIILLKNDKQLLPLNINSLKSLAVIGPNANQVQYGDYSSTRDSRSGTTVLNGIKQFVGDKVKINYARGCGTSGTDKSGFDEAVDVAKNSDAVVVVLGTTSVVFSGIGWNGHTPEGEPKDPFTCGEGYDVTDINPDGVQRELLQAIYKTGKPVILVLVHGRPWSINWEKENIPAILEAWYPGEKGGNAIANILFGKVNPSGRLNVSIPQSVGHIPVFYNHVNTSKGFYHNPGTPDKPGQDYVFSSSNVLYPFGYGLSYTTFKYSNMQVSSPVFGKDQQVTVSVDVTNEGKVEGKEVVQMYLGNKINSVTTPVMELKGFDKISLKPGETQTVKFIVKPEDIAIWNLDMKQVTEPGTFDVMIARSAEDVVLKKTLEYKE